MGFKRALPFLCACMHVTGMCLMLCRHTSLPLYLLSYSSPALLTAILLSCRSCFAASLPRVSAFSHLVASLFGLLDPFCIVGVWLFAVPVMIPVLLCSPLLCAPLLCAPLLCSPLLSRAFFTGQKISPGECSQEGEAQGTNGFLHSAAHVAANAGAVISLSSSWLPSLVHVTGWVRPPFRKVARSR